MIKFAYDSIDQIPHDEITPMMQQYKDLKAENPGYVLLFRCGDFYELFFEDAIAVSKALELVLTSKMADRNGGRVALCGIPYHALDRYGLALLREGIDIAIADQIGDPIEGQPWPRAVIRVVEAKGFKWG
jgi:DNA mismatch repair protein MutS